jgi:hypothetical protein
MSELVKIMVDLSSKAISIECSEASIDKVFERVEALLTVINEIKLEESQVGLEESSPSESQAQNNSTVSSAPSKRNRGKGKAETYNNVDLGLTEPQKRQFTEFYKQKAPKTGEEKLLTVMVWLAKNAKKEKLNKDEVFSGFRVVAERVNIKITSYMSTLKANGKLTYEGDGSYKITHHAEDFVERDLPRATVK